MWLIDCSVEGNTEDGQQLTAQSEGGEKAAEALAASSASASAGAANGANVDSDSNTQQQLPLTQEPHIGTVAANTVSHTASVGAAGAVATDQKSDDGIGDEGEWVTLFHSIFVTTNYLFSHLKFYLFLLPIFIPKILLTLI